MPKSSAIASSTTGWSFTASASTAKAEPGLTPVQRLRIAARVAGCLALFAVIGPAQLVVSALGRRDVLPPPFLAAIGWLCGLRVSVRGSPAAAPVLLLANHVSWLDILGLAGASRSAFAGKDALAVHPFLRWLCEQNDTIFLQRDHRQTVAQQVAAMRAALARRPLTLFPEGTTSDGRALLPFKSSLLAAAEGTGVTVQPVALDYADAAEIAWGQEPGLRNIWAILARRRPVRLTIRFLNPLPEAMLGDRKALAPAAQRAITEALPL
ncbi:MAG: lysophospholipid acyltransferase family protein [Croceibacterium sp.]